MNRILCVALAALSLCACKSPNLASDSVCAQMTADGWANPTICPSYKPAK